MPVTLSSPTLLGDRDSEKPHESLVEAFTLQQSVSKSPFANTEITTLGIGPNKTPYLVHRSKLSQSPVLNLKSTQKLWGDKGNNIVSLPELDDATAHALVEYLYSGKYETLANYDLTQRNAVDNYKEGTCIYCAAIRYVLPGLAELAKEKIISLGEDLTIMEILRIAREHAFPLLPQDESWFPSYLEDAIKSAMTEDPGLFDKPEFSDQIEGDRRFRHVVMKAIANSFRMGFGSLSPPSSRPAASVTEDRIEPTAVADEEEAVVTAQAGAEAEIVEEMPVVAVKIAQAPNGTAPEQPGATVHLTNGSIKLDDIEPTIETRKAPEPFTDELGFGNSKTFKQMAKPKEPTSQEAPAVAEKLPSRPAHTRSDSIVQGQETLSVTKTDEKPAPKVESSATIPAASATDASPTVANGSTPASTEGLSKNQLKKLRQKQKKEAAALGTSLAA